MSLYSNVGYHLLSHVTRPCYVLKPPHKLLKEYIAELQLVCMNASLTSIAEHKQADCTLLYRSGLAGTASCWGRCHLVSLAEESFRCPCSSAA